MEQANKSKEVKQRFKDELKEKFNEQKFDDDIKSGKVISYDNLNEYKRQDDDIPPKIPKANDDVLSNGQGLSFRAKFKNGQWAAIGSNGHIIQSKNIDDFHRKLAQVFKLDALKKGKEACCCLISGKNAQNKKLVTESFARNFINAGIVVQGDLPQTPEFWKKLKSEYLAQEGNDLKTWNRLTRFVPKEYMQEKTKNTSQHISKAILPIITRAALGRQGR